MIETNIDPSLALSDSDQTISLEEFDSLMKEIEDRVNFERKYI